MPLPTVTSRPNRWDHPFSRDGSEDQHVDDSVIDRLLLSVPFSEMDEAGFRRSLPLREILRNDTRIQKYKQGDLVVRSGDWGNSAFFILNGKLRAEIESSESQLPVSLLGRKSPGTSTLLKSFARLWKKSPSQRPEIGIGTRQQGEQTRVFVQDLPTFLDRYRTSVLMPGQWFGELSALGRTPRTTTVFAEQESELLEIRWQGLRDLMRYDKNHAVKAQVEAAFREHGLIEFLEHDPTFQHLTREQLTQLASQVQFQTWGEYDSPKPFKALAKEGYENNFESEALIFAEGDYPNHAIMIRSGLARLTVNHFHGQRTVEYLTPGQSYGFQEIIDGSGNDHAVPYRCSLRAISFLSAILIPTPVVEGLLAEHHPRISTHQSAAAKPNRIECKKSVPEHLINFFVENHYVQGTGAMLIDLDRCVRCDDCVRACAATHDHQPRFIRHGPVHHNYMIANSCLHCLDPVCMVECPTGAIHRHLQNGHIVINEATCIGCAQCANNCPFDAIRMVPLTDSHGTSIVDDKTGQTLNCATKCDFCTDQSGGPACQAACSHDALFRIDLSDFQQVQDHFSR